jgi:hypothetical protein
MFANLDNARGDFVPPKDVPSENDRLTNGDAAAEEGKSALTVTRNCTEGRILEHNQEQFEKKVLRTRSAKMSEKGGNAGVSDRTRGELDGKGSTDVAGLRSTKKLHLNATDGKVSLLRKRPE